MGNVRLMMRGSPKMLEKSRFWCLINRFFSRSISIRDATLVKLQQIEAILYSVSTSCLPLTSVWSISHCLCLPIQTPVHSPQGLPDLHLSFESRITHSSKICSMISWCFIQTHPQCGSLSCRFPEPSFPAPGMEIGPSSHIFSHATIISTYVVPVS